MTAFSIRVELHDATSADYAKLADRLAAREVVDVIRNDKGELFKLPPAEYNFEGNATLDNVYEAVCTITATIGRKYAVVVTQAARRMWCNLPRA
ncbi:MAG: hypothetical protein ACXW2U_08975 [Telluria sp.]